MPRSYIENNLKLISIVSILSFQRGKCDKAEAVVEDGFPIPAYRTWSHHPNPSTSLSLHLGNMCFPLYSTLQTENRSFSLFILVSDIIAFGGGYLILYRMISP